MTYINIKDDDLSGLKNRVIIVTGGSSGIGLATTNLLLGLGAKVVIGDLQPPTTPIESEHVDFHKTDVTVWSEQLGLFKKARQLHGRIDHVFANAGIGPKADYLSTALDLNGDLVEPTFVTLDVNLKAVIYTATIAVYYMRAKHQSPAGGSIVIVSSVAGVSRFRAVDYATAKHGTLGFGRGLHQRLTAESSPTRVNLIAPSWTRTGFMPPQIMAAVGVEPQEPVLVGRAAAFLMADESRKGQMIHVAKGKYREVEESIMIPAAEKVVDLENGGVMEDDTLAKIIEAMGIFRTKAAQQAASS